MGNDADNKLEAPKLGLMRKKRGKATEAAPQPAGAEAEKEPRTRILTSVVRRAAAPATPAAESQPAETEPAEDVPRAPRPAKKAKAAREPREAPISDGPLAAGLTGLAVGLFLVVAVWVCEQISQQMRGTTSLGRAGLPLLVAIFVLAVVGGMLLLRLAKTPSPGSTSFLATGLVAVLTVLFLGDHDDTLWAGVVVVVLAIAAFLLSRWITVRYIDTE